MSIKTGVAWRVNVERLNEALELVWDAMMSQATERYGRYMQRVRQDFPNAGVLGLEFALQDRLLARLRQLNHDPISCGLWVNFHGAHAVLRPWGDYAFTMDYDPNAAGLALPGWMEPFDYQDQVDEDEEIMAAAVAREVRRQTWNAIVGHPNFLRHTLTYAVVDLHKPESLSEPFTRWFHSLPVEEQNELFNRKENPVQVPDRGEG